MADSHKASSPRASQKGWEVAGFRYRFEPGLQWHLAQYEDQLPNRALFPKMEIEPIYAAAPVTIAEGDGWLPIETAPRDETGFLACGLDSRGRPHYAVIWWDSRGWWLRTSATQFPWSHWRPLPPPPRMEVE